MSLEMLAIRPVKAGLITMWELNNDSNADIELLFKLNEHLDLENYNQYQHQESLRKQQESASRKR